MDLKNISTKDLVATLLERKIELVRSDGMLDGYIWPLRTALGAIACVDGVAIRRIGDIVEGGVIRRVTGRFPNKLALIGGVVGLYESIDTAMKRHWRTDLGLEIKLPLGWQRPVCMRQYAPQVDSQNRMDFCHDPGKHSYASTHLVKIVSDPRSVTLGATEYGGQEAASFHWYSKETCPPAEEWSYDMHESFLFCLEQAKNSW